MNQVSGNSSNATVVTEEYHESCLGAERAYYRIQIGLLCFLSAVTSSVLTALTLLIGG